ncbi:heavy-metal-associated domain-containing protein [Sphingobium fuliginis]|uniref:Heavy-metal-associated domain-containing protein n=1 Tax=Sphingobium fuliginis ATCC 27551 TaxID=1208342 RepID=A0A5B8CFC4_SPHSA|nr:heavy-metal-associated domain-containing protein [Sphingobium fuliginis]QDC38023.1 heavy-metal-associated domain-containing protein [Sphingobium fuliginis ATCC 27551]
MNVPSVLRGLSLRPLNLFRAASRPIQILGAIMLGLAAAALVAQMEGERGVPPIASGGDFQVSHVKVDVFAKDADSARKAGWRLAQRRAWQMLWTRTHGGSGAPALSDSQLEGMISGIEIEYEQAGPTRYVATLGVMFDRARTGQLLGVTGNVMRSPPLLVIPVLWDGGSAVSYERINEWQRAWARFRTGDSAIDYVRVAGSIADPILLNAGQTGRRGRLWWRVLLDQYGAADVVIPIARLDRQYPGGPVTGTFTARYGPDNFLIGSFSLRASNDSAIPQMLDQATQRIDQLYTQALNDGRLRPDPSLIIEEPVDPNALEIENAADLPVETLDMPTPAATTGSYAIQFDTPDVGSVAQGEAAVRSIAGVRSAATSSLALGGTSVMQVNFDGSVDMLRAALGAKGYNVAVSGNTLRIRRGGTPGAGSAQ